MEKEAGWAWQENGRQGKEKGRRKAGHGGKKPISHSWQHTPERYTCEGIMPHITAWYVNQYVYVSGKLCNVFQPINGRK